MLVVLVSGSPSPMQVPAAIRVRRRRPLSLAMEGDFSQKHLEGDRVLVYHVRGYVPTYSSSFGDIYKKNIVQDSTPRTRHGGMEPH